MKRSIIATLLILVLALSGCKAQQEAGTAVPAERVEAEKKQETSQAVPEESETEQELPAEEEKPVEQDQTDKQEKPAEEEPKGNGSEIVKFWETVPEMSFDEALQVYRVWEERLEKEQRLGVLTDEERMAFYTINKACYDERVTKNPETELLYKDFFLQMDEAFAGNIAEFLEKNDWKKQDFAQKYLMNVKELCDIATATSKIGPDFYHGGERISKGVRYSGTRVCLSVIPNEKIKDDYNALYIEILRHYLSLKSVAYCHGPIGPWILSYD